MKRHLWILSFAALFISLPGWTQVTSGNNIEQYINRYKDIAMKEQVRTGVPAAITLAQGICETGAGTSELCLEAHNHFGIKCKRNWQGQTYLYDDDHKSECFRKYDNPLESFKDHSDFLRNNPRYARLFELKPTDYKRWAEGLKKCGYATNRHYAEKLIAYIKDYDLEQYTKLAMSGKIHVPEKTDEGNAGALLADNGDNPVALAGSVNQAQTEEQSIAPAVSEKEEKSITYYVTTQKNGLKGFYARKGDLLLAYAINHHIRYGKLLAWNGLPDKPLKTDMFIYLERKRKKGLQPYFEVKPGMDLHKVSQETGVEPEQLRLLNHLQPGEEPAAGTLLALQQPAEDKVKTMVAPITEETQADNARKETAVSQTKRADNVDYVLVRPVNNHPEEAGSIPVASGKEKEDAINTNSVPESENDRSNDMAHEARESGTPEMEQKGEVAIAKPLQTENAEKQLVSVENTETPVPNEKEKTQVEKLRAMMDKIVYSEEPRKPQIESQEPKRQEQSPKKETAAPAAAKQNPEVTPTERLRAFMKTVASRRKEQKKETYTTLPPGQSAKRNEGIAEHRPGASSGSKYYTVKRGDTAYSIAKQFGISLKQLKAWNHLPASLTVQLGARLRVGQ